MRVKSADCVHKSQQAKSLYTQILINSFDKMNDVCVCAHEGGKHSKSEHLKGFIVGDILIVLFWKLKRNHKQRRWIYDW